MSGPDNGLASRALLYIPVLGRAERRHHGVELRQFPHSRDAACWKMGKLARQGPCRRFARLTRAGCTGQLFSLYTPTPRWLKDGGLGNLGGRVANPCPLVPFSQVWNFFAWWFRSAVLEGSIYDSSSGIRERLSKGVRRLCFQLPHSRVLRWLLACPRVPFARRTSGRLVSRDVDAKALRHGAMFSELLPGIAIKGEQQGRTEGLYVQDGVGRRESRWLFHRRPRLPPSRGIGRFLNSAVGWAENPDRGSPCPPTSYLQQKMR